MTNRTSAYQEFRTLTAADLIAYDRRADNIEELLIECRFGAEDFAKPGQGVVCLRFPPSVAIRTHPAVFGRHHRHMRASTDPSGRWRWKTESVPSGGFRDSSTELHAERLMMRTWHLADAAQVYDACQDDEIQRWTRVPSPYSTADADGFVANSPERWNAGLPSFGIFEPDGRSLLGSMGFVRSPDPGVLELGYWVAPAARRHGVATDATRLVCDWAFEHPDAHRIEWMAYVGNVASRRVAEQCGFQFEGVLRSRAEHRGAWVDVWIAGLVRSDQPAEQ